VEHVAGKRVTHLLFPVKTAAVEATAGRR
jgi:hypothetical protein